jgi:4-hydroxy-4-methyl-2-oxoglutarate aldolase
MPIDLTAELRDELLTLGSATLYEASGAECFLPATLRPAWPGAQIVGTALPVLTAAGDNLPLHLALELAAPGEVLVVDAGAAPHGYWGEVLTEAAQARGILGLIIDGGVRDTAQLEALDFPVFSSHIALRGTTKTDAGTIGKPIQLGVTTVARGDVVVADNDGAVVFTQSDFERILESSRARLRKETEFIERLRAGESTMDLYGFARP